MRDGEAGQDYAVARQYQPRHGRFTTVDPVFAGLFDHQGWNRYAYARNSPLTFVDPGGLQERTPDFNVHVVGTLPRPQPTDPLETELMGWLGGMFLDAGYISRKRPISEFEPRGVDRFAGLAALETISDPGAPAPPVAGAEPPSNDPPAPPAASIMEPPPSPAAPSVADEEMVIPGVVGWKTGIPEIRTSRLGLQRAGTVITTSGLLGGALLLRPRFVGPSAKFDLKGEGRLFGVVFGGGFLAIHVDYHPYPGSMGSQWHANIVFGAANQHVPLPSWLFAPFTKY